MELHHLDKYTNLEAVDGHSSLYCDQSLSHIDQPASQKRKDYEATKLSMQVKKKVKNTLPIWSADVRRAGADVRRPGADVRRAGRVVARASRGMVHRRS